MDSNLTNEQKAQRLEEMAAEHAKDAEFFRRLKRGYEPDIAQAVAHEAKAALLRESAQMWRERGAVRWEDSELCENCMAVYKGWLIRVDRASVPTAWRVYDGDLLHVFLGKSSDVSAAQAAAVAWVDAQGGKP